MSEASKHEARRVDSYLAWLLILALPLFVAVILIPFGALNDWVPLCSANWRLACLAGYVLVYLAVYIYRLSLLAKKPVPPEVQAEITRQAQGLRRILKPLGIGMTGGLLVLIVLALSFSERGFSLRQWIGFTAAPLVCSGFFVGMLYAATVAAFWRRLFWLLAVFTAFALSDACLLWFITN